MFTYFFTDYLLIFFASSPCLIVINEPATMVFYTALVGLRITYCLKTSSIFDTKLATDDIC